MTANRIAKILQAYPARVSVVVFNTCDSAAMAKDLAATGAVDITIGWEGKVPDWSRFLLLNSFTHHIGNGLSVGYAFVLASECAAPEDAAFPGALFSRSGGLIQDFLLLST